MKSDLKGILYEIWLNFVYEIEFWMVLILSFLMMLFEIDERILMSEWILDIENVGRRRRLWEK